MGGPKTPSSPSEGSSKNSRVDGEESFRLVEDLDERKGSRGLDCGLAEDGVARGGVLDDVEIGEGVVG
jgi:hypothetical protein